MKLSYIQRTFVQTWFATATRWRAQGAAACLYDSHRSDFACGSLHLNQRPIFPLDGKFVPQLFPEQVFRELVQPVFIDLIYRLLAELVPLGFQIVFLLLLRQVALIGQFFRPRSVGQGKTSRTSGSSVNQ